jgi:ParB family transcriptional regulator, chromosome partitioning protein
MHISNHNRLYTLSKSLNIVSSTPGIIEDIQISKIKYSSNPLRTHLSGVEDLVDSIRANGLLQPIVVRPKEVDFEIVAGNRRREACKLLRWKKITCHVVNLDDKQAFETSLIENLHRETLEPIEEAQAYKAYVADFGWGGVSELAKKVGKSPSYITKRIKLLNLPNDVINSLYETSLNSSVAEELCSLKDPLKQSELADLIIRRHLSLRKARELVDHHRDDKVVYTFDSSIEHSLRVFDKLILLLRVALNNIGGMISDNEDEWVLKEVMMYHRNMIHQQIDLLIKEKRKFDRRLLALNFSAPKNFRAGTTIKNNGKKEDYEPC